MSTRWIAWCVLAVASCVCQALAVAGSNDVLEELGSSLSTTQLIEKVDAQVGSSIETVLADYDREIEQQPHDVTLRIQRCRFLQEYVASFEAASFLDRLYEMSEACDRQLEQDFPEHPEVLLLRLENSYGEQRLNLAREILATLLTEGWTHGQLARLYAAMANASEAAKHSTDAVEYARRALRFDETADVRLLLAREELARGEESRAIALLTTDFDAARHRDSWYLLEKMQLLSRADAVESAASLYEQLAKADYYDHLQAAKALGDARAIDLARQEIAKAAEIYAQSAENEKQLFLLEYEHGTSATALAAYDAWRDAGWRQDPIALNRFALVMRDITLPWSARDVLALCLGIVVLAMAALVCGAPVGIVHYWGFVRRHRTGGAYPGEGWQLRHAWAALAAYGVMAIVGAYAAGPIDFNVHSLLQLDGDLRPRQWSRYVLAEALLTTVAMIAVLRYAKSIGNEQPWGSNWSWPKAIVIGAAIGIGLRVPLALTVLSRPDIIPLVSDNELWQTLRHVRNEFGLASVLWLLALMAPAVEEFIFRKVLLEAFSSHVGFARANVVQAALFAAIHVDARALLPLFGFGLLAGYLARRSGGFLAPMVAHGLFNLIAGLLLLR